MRAVLFVLLLSGATLLAGCADDQEQAAADLKKVYGNNAVQVVNGTQFLVLPVLEGQFDTGGNASWSATPSEMLEPPTVVLDKPMPPPGGGGGEEYALEAPNATLNVRFRKAGDLEGYDARWALITRPGQAITWSASAPATQAKAFSVSPGLMFVGAELLRGTRTVAVTLVPLNATLSVTWTVESSVQPVKPPQQPPPDNYDEMADIFPFDLGSPLPQLRATTAFRGTFEPGMGTDVDLQVTDPSGEAVVCQATGDPSGDPTGGFVPDPSQSSEEIEMEDVAPGTWAIRVGAVTCMGGDAYQYTNAGPVPYTLTLEVLYD